MALVIGIVIGVYIQSDPESPDATKTMSMQNPAIVANDRIAVKNTATDRVSADINRLNRQFQNEIRARQALELKVEELSRQMAKLDDNLQSFKASNDSEQEANNSDSEVSGSDDNWFNEQALVDSGMSSSRASELKTYFEQLELERLYLRDQSIRESWDRVKYREALQTLVNQEDDLRNQLSESEYDAYLYASGQTNRVAVTSVLASAQAGTAGIKSGDQIIR